MNKSDSGIEVMANTAPPPRNLIQKAAAVMEQVEYVPKNGWNDFHKYHYATEADITSCVRVALAEQGLMLIPTVEKVEWTKIQGKSGEDRLATLTVKFTLTDGNDKIEFHIIGEGQDRGDKATYKAMTGALKYALLKLFLIPTGDDPERDDGDRPEQQRPPVQRPPSKAEQVIRQVASAPAVPVDKALLAKQARVQALVNEHGSPRALNAFIEAVLGKPAPQHLRELTPEELTILEEKTKELNRDVP